MAVKISLRISACKQKKKKKKKTKKIFTVMTSQLYNSCIVVY